MGICVPGAGTTTATAFGNTLSSRQANFDGRHPLDISSPRPVPGTNVRGRQLWGKPVGPERHARQRLGVVSGRYVDPPPGKNVNATERSPKCAVRGGGWDSLGKHCRSDQRAGYAPNARRSFIGFRFALVKPRDRPGTHVIPGARSSLARCSCTAGDALRPPGRARFWSFHALRPVIILSAW